jgi:hypothetical protein
MVALYYIVLLAAVLMCICAIYDVLKQTKELNNKPDNYGRDTD